MNKYELLIILSASLNEDELSASIKKYTDIIENNGGRISTVNKWGIKKFTYLINQKKEGHYVLLEFESETNVPLKISQLMNIDDNIYRNLCIKKIA